MKMNLDCVPCFQQQALRAARTVGAGDDTQRTILEQVMRGLLASDWEGAPIHLAQGVYRTVREVTGVDDPYRELKEQSNRAVLSAYPEMAARVERSADPLRTAARLAIAGNIMDYGALAEFNLDETLPQVESQAFAVDDLEELRERLHSAGTLLYFADNAGEIVFDRLLLETLCQQHSLAVSFVVKSGPMINDATPLDAEQAGLLALPHLTLLEVDNGDGEGAPDYFSNTVGQWIDSHEVVIAKGQANYEALSEHPGVFHLLLAKCPLIARDIGVPQWSLVLQRRGGGAQGTNGHSGSA